MGVNWKHMAEWAKRRPATLRVADRLGRGRGRLRVLDRLTPVNPAAFIPDLRHWQDHDLAATWIGHATVLLRMEGRTILTDPVFGPRVGVGLGLITGGPKRHVAPALVSKQLPKIDLLLLSHAHFDHLDRPSLDRLDRSIPVVTADHTRDLIADLGYRNVTELRWGESCSPLPGFTITARKVNHWGARTFYDHHRGFNAYLIESPNRRVLFGGDSGYHDYYTDLRHIDLAILGIGAYNPWEAAHATPEQALRMADHCRAECVMGIHHSTFKLSREPLTEPLERLLEAAGDDQRVVASQVGELWVR
jgi:L-ascorbate metabolism protein UlaG (beta-lactamase superfamily)